MKGGSKQNKTKFTKLIKKQFKTKRNEISFRNISKFFIVTHLCYSPPSKIHVTMVSGRSVCSMCFSYKACLSHGMSPIFHRLVSSAKGNKVSWISKRNKTKRNSSLRKLIQYETKLKQSNFGSKQKETKFRNIFISNTPTKYYTSLLLCVFTPA